MVESNHHYTAIHDIEYEEQRARSRKKMLIGCTVFILIAAVIGAVVGSLVFGTDHKNKNSNQETSQASPYTPSATSTTSTTPTTPTSPTSPTATNPNVQTVDPNITVPKSPTLNPPTYPPSTCSMPNYISKDNTIYAVSTNETMVPIQIKGINWFGMETSNNIPFGLWDNGVNGTTVFEIVKFLADNKFNSVRLPVSIYSILHNTPPRKDIINVATNTAIKLDTYMDLLQSLVLALGYRNISVLISLHTLKPDTLSGLWYSNEIPESDVLTAIGKVTTSLCSPIYWNILGIDAKNEPSSATWGDGSATDFQLGATRLGNKILDGCPSWLVFVEGIFSTHHLTAEGISVDYGDWWGGGLQNARNKPVELSIANKVVYAPHYYPPSVFPQTYFYDSKSNELSDDDLKKVVRLTMDDMFGFLATTQSHAMVIGEFGGLYTTDQHPKRTIQRVIQYNIELMQRPGWSGGYLWSLNPESLYQYNPFTTQGDFYEGLYQHDWKTPNQPYLDALQGLDSMPNLRMFPCFSN